MDISNFVSKVRFNKYLLYSNNDNARAVELYNINLKISSSLYIPLSYFEVILRNFCNEKLKKEVGDYWFDNEKVIISSDNKTIKKITEAKNLVINKHFNNYIPTNDDIISNLSFGFWCNLFCKKNENILWSKYLKHIFVGFNRKDLYKIIKETNDLRNRVFHYEPIIFDEKLYEKYNNIISLLIFMSDKELIEIIESINDFKENIKKLGSHIKPVSLNNDAYTEYPF